jgi:hypothetical protein
VWQRLSLSRRFRQLVGGDGTSNRQTPGKARHTVEERWLLDAQA